MINEQMADLRSLFLEILCKGSSLIASNIQKVPIAKLTWDEKSRTRSCLILFPFSDLDICYIEKTAYIAKGIFNRSFSGIHPEPNSFYMRLMDTDDFDDTTSVSILFGFYTDPCKTDNLPRKVKITSVPKKYEWLHQLIFAPVPFNWNSMLICAKLPIPWLKIPENSPFRVEFQPTNEYPNIKPIGITFHIK